MLATRELRSEKRCKAGGSVSALPCDQGSVEYCLSRRRADWIIWSCTATIRKAAAYVVDTGHFETAKAHFRAKGEHPFRVIKQQFGFKKTRLRGMLKNSCKVNVLAALSNLFMARRGLLCSS